MQEYLLLFSLILFMGFVCNSLGRLVKTVQRLVEIVIELEELTQSIVLKVLEMEVAQLKRM